MTHAEVYIVYSRDYDGNVKIFYISTDCYCAISWAEDLYKRTQYHVWVEFQEINLTDFDLGCYSYYDPDEESICWEKKDRIKSK